MSINGLIGRALASVGNGGAGTAFLYAFAVGFGFGCGILMSAAVFDLLPSPLAP